MSAAKRLQWKTLAPPRETRLPAAGQPEPAPPTIDRSDPDPTNCPPRSQTANLAWAARRACRRGVGPSHATAPPAAGARSPDAAPRAFALGKLGRKPKRRAKLAKHHFQSCS